MKRVLFVVIIGVLALSAVLVGAQDDDKIMMAYESLHPEGIEYYDGAFFVSSMTEGDIFRVELDGTITQFTDDERLVSSIGLWVDADNGRMLVANSDPGVGIATGDATVGQLAALGVYDLMSGETLDYYELSAIMPGGHFANDVTMDDAGNIYVTDSFSPIIYRIDADGNAEIWLEDDTFAGEGFHLNGIVYHADGYLIVSRAAEGELYKVPVDDPTAFSLIETDELPGPDGLALDDDGVLYAVTGGGAFALESDDDWVTATVTGASAGPEIGTYTTGVVVDGDLWVVNSRFDVLFNPEATETVPEFEMVRISFE